MGVVYKAIDTALDAQVALKLIRPDLVDVGDFADRFRREVRLTRQITHPNVCRVHDLGDAAGILFLSMEWIEGETLQRFLRQTGKHGSVEDAVEGVFEAAGSSQEFVVAASVDRLELP